jgi:hypothetical protein
MKSILLDGIIISEFCYQYVVRECGIIESLLEQSLEIR